MTRPSLPLLAGLLPLLAGLLATGCDPIAPMPENQPCLEAGYAIAARTAQCTGDVALGDDRYAQYRREFSCIGWSAGDEELWDSAGPAPEDLFSCAFTIRNLPCEVVADLGGDIEGWLATDPGCTWVVERKGGGQ